VAAQNDQRIIAPEDNPMNLDEVISKGKKEHGRFHPNIDELIKPLKAWLGQTLLPFHNAEFSDCMAGKNALALKVKGENGYLIRVCHKDVEPRGLIPYLIQPLGFRSEEYKDIVIEIVPDRPKKIFNTIPTDKFKENVRKSGYEISVDDPDLREFDYIDKTRKKRVAIAIDPGDIKNNENVPPTCVEGYPTLEAQLDLQKGLVKHSQKLRDYLEYREMELPEHAQETNIIKHVKTR
jgi:hypothetical protein